jgi:hypothetical protein
MKARIPKEYRDLSPSGQDRLREFCRDIALQAAQEQEEKDCRIMLEIFIKWNILLLHDTEHWGEIKCRRYLWNHKRLFQRQAKLVSKGEQLEYLDRRMAEIFKKDGFPQDFIDELLGPVDLTEKPADQLPELPKSQPKNYGTGAYLMQERTPEGSGNE